MNFFDTVKLSPPDPILGLTQAFKADPRETKVNLGVGVYKTTELKPFILSSVKKAEALILETESSKDYLPIDGSSAYCDLVQELVFGKKDEKVYVAQMTGETAALRVGGAFLKELGFQKIFISDPTWGNHKQIFSHAHMDVETYPYYDPKNHALDFEGICQTIKDLPSKSCILFQAACHNPTGIDPTQEQWKEICDLLKGRDVFPFFDFAYQGFGEGLEEDAYPIRLFAQEGLQFAVASSNAKNFGLYAERAGALFIVTQSQKEAERVGSQVKLFIRAMYSNPPLHGGQIVTTILNHPELKEMWEHELTMIRERIVEMRNALCAQLNVKGAGHRFDSLTQQKGMFSYTGLDRDQVDQLLADYGIYMLKNGRINVAGLNTENVGYVAEAIVNVIG